MGNESRLDVLEQGELWNDIGAVKRAAYAHQAKPMRRSVRDVTALEPHFSRIGTQMARDQVEKGGLARTVWADHGGDLALRYAQAYSVDRCETVERLAHVLNLKHCGSPSWMPLSALGARALAQRARPAFPGCRPETHRAAR